MNETKTMVPATGCLEASWASVRPSGTGTEIGVHFPVFGLYGDLTLAIAMHGRPATSADLDSWLVRSAEQGGFYPGDWGDGELWKWHPDDDARGGMGPGGNVPPSQISGAVFIHPHSDAPQRTFSS